jgi:hypothetical protein
MFEVSDIEGPVLTQVGYKEYLATTRIFVLPEKSTAVAAEHHRRVPGVPITENAVRAFIMNAGQSFPSRDADGNPSFYHQLTFTITYKALDGRQYTTPCLLHFNLGINVLRAQVVQRRVSLPLHKGRMLLKNSPVREWAEVPYRLALVCP